MIRVSIEPTSVRAAQQAAARDGVDGIESKVPFLVRVSSSLLRVTHCQSALGAEDAEKLATRLVDETTKRAKVVYPDAPAEKIDGPTVAESLEAAVAKVTTTVERWAKIDETDEDPDAGGSKTDEGKSGGDGEPVSAEDMANGSSRDDLVERAEGLGIEVKSKDNKTTIATAIIEAEAAEAAEDKAAAEAGERAGAEAAGDQPGGNGEVPSSEDETTTTEADA